MFIAGLLLIIIISDGMNVQILLLYYTYLQKYTTKAYKLLLSL